MDTFVPAAATTALVFTLINTLKYLVNKNWNGVITQCIVWVSGVAVVLLAAQTDWADQIGSALIGSSLATLDFWSQAFVGLTIGALATVTNEFKTAFDNTDSAAKPALLPPPPPPNE